MLLLSLLRRLWRSCWETLWYSRHGWCQWRTRRTRWISWWYQAWKRPTPSRWETSVDIIRVCSIICISVVCDSLGLSQLEKMGRKKRLVLSFFCYSVCNFLEILNLELCLYRKQNPTCLQISMPILRRWIEMRMTRKTRYGPMCLSLSMSCDLSHDLWLGADHVIWDQAGWTWNITETVNPWHFFECSLQFGYTQLHWEGVPIAGRVRLPERHPQPWYQVNGKIMSMYDSVTVTPLN